MRTRWEDLAVRARGLAGHLLRTDEIDALARSPDREALANALRARGYLLGETAATADALELAVRRTAAAQLRLLARWAGPRHIVLSVLFEDEDRRSLRAIIRGAVQGAPAGARLAGLIPTPSLPERALRELARQMAPRDVATLLTAWRNAYGPPLFPAVNAVRPDLLELEYRLNHTFAGRALHGARASGSPALLAYVREGIDCENASAALALVASEDRAAKYAFVSGGRELSLAMFLDAIAAREPAEAVRRLASSIRPYDRAFAGVIERTLGNASLIEDQMLRYRIGKQQASALRDPAGIASVLSYVLRLRAEALDLLRVIWGVALSAPQPELVVSPVR